MIRQIQEHYQLQVGEITTFGKYKGFWLRNKIYILLPVNEFKEEELVELKNFSDYLTTAGDYSVSTFVPNVNGYYVTEIGNQNYVLVKGNRVLDRTGLNLGKELAEFHLKGKVYTESIQAVSRLGKWKDFWEQRLEQLEKFWMNKVNALPTNSFDRLFVKTFPYYLGMSENAIQYLVDTELDDEPKTFDAGAMTYERFTPETWNYRYIVKLPTEWVYDHPSRDLSEYVRHHFNYNVPNTDEIMNTFFTEYEKVSPLSTFAWRLLYARLLFPVHYFEMIESYYSARSTAEKLKIEEELKRIIQESSNYERKLKHFFRNIQLPAERIGIRLVDWLV